MSSKLLILVLLLFVLAVIRVVTVDSNGDFYSLLGVDKGADDKTIRKAFKRLAIKLHPDKNTGDADAHDKFVRVNRAYEVLKDEELRKKYDLYGEEGLKDDFQGGHGQQYQSWQFYRDNFGIYDDDAEIITLNRGDFEQSVLRTADFWFVNFYSPQCGHCHELALTWRTLAQEFKGVVRIGAVNCGDEWAMCQQQGVMSYPSLIVYPERQKFQGERQLESLTEFLLGRLAKHKVHRVNEENMKRLTTESKITPWLLDFCEDETDSHSCLSFVSRRKLAAMLDGLVNIGTVNCDKEPLCKKLGHHSGIVFWNRILSVSSGIVINSLDTQEIAAAVLKLLPDVAAVTKEQFEEIEKAIQLGDKPPHLVYFADAQVDTEIRLEIKKVPSLLDGITCVMLNCSEWPSVCADFHIAKFPTFVILKRNGGYEIHHGRHTAHDVASFATDCAATTVRALDALSFEKLVGKDPDQDWFVDFFAPWCPPCMRLLPEFRRASTQSASVNFATVDCTLHLALCQQNGVQSYPTTVFFNGSEPHTMVGPHAAQELLDFIEVGFYCFNL